MEVNSNKYWPTWYLLQELKKLNPNYKFTFCMGSDLLPSFRKWEQGERLAEEASFIILNRPNYISDKSLFPKISNFIEIAIEGSSTAIRTRISKQFENANKLNLGINGLTTKSVIIYIRENCLFQVCEIPKYQKNSNKSLNGIQLKYENN